MFLLSARRSVPDHLSMDFLAQPMKPSYLIPALFLAATLQIVAQDEPAQDQPAESRRDFHYSLSIIDDVTLYSNLQVPAPRILNQFLIEPAFTARYKPNWSFSTSLVGIENKYNDSYSQLRVKETYAGLSAGDFDFTLGRRIVRWGTGYAFTAAGVLDPPRDPTNPTDRLNLNEGRDMVKVDYVYGPHALSVAWSSAALAPESANLHDTTAFRYNVLMHGFDTSLIAAKDRGGDAFGGVTFTRVLGEAWEIHGEAAWREHEAILLGAKYTTHTGITLMTEFFSPPNIPYYRNAGISPLAGRQNSLFISAGKNRLRELPEWKRWDLSAAGVINLNDSSYTAIFDVTRRFGNRISSYLHLEVPSGSSGSEYGQTPYSAATSFGLRFQL